MRTVAWAAALIGLAASTSAAQPEEPETPFPTQGWVEAVLSVSDLETLAEFFVEVGGYEELHRGNVDTTRLAYWDLPAESQAREAVFGDPGETRGRIRLIEFDGVEQQRMRYAGSPWDTGGWFSLSMWAQDLDEAAAAALARQWQPYAEPMEVPTAYGRLRTLLLRGPDDITFTLYEVPETPSAHEPAAFEQLSAPFAASATVREPDINRDFYTDVFDLDEIPANAAFAPGDGEAVPNPFGLPRNLTGYTERRRWSIHPAGDERAGVLELLHWPHLASRDFSERTVAPHLGLLALRYRVPSTGALAEALNGRGEAVEEPVSAVLPPYGIVHQMRLQTPHGADLEFFSLMP